MHRYFRESLDLGSDHIEKLSSGSLRIHNVTDEDAGVYSCRAYNGVGTATHTYTVVVDGEFCVEIITANLADLKTCKGFFPKCIYSSTYLFIAFSH